jgi:hypothetical protein
VPKLFPKIDDGPINEAPSNKQINNVKIKMHPYTNEYGSHVVPIVCALALISPQNKP